MRNVVYLIAALMLAAPLLSHSAEETRPQYIIRFKDDLPRTELLRLIKEITVEHGLDLRHTYKSAIQGFSAGVPRAKLVDLQTHPAIEAIEANRVWYLHVLDPPTNIVAVAPNDSQIDLTWTDNATTEVAFDIHRSTTGASGLYERLSIVITEDLESYTDTRVTADQEYCYIIRAAESPFSLGSFSVPVCATPGGASPGPPPAAPNGLVATPVASDNIDIGWNDLSVDENGFRIERALGTGGAFAEIATVAADVEVFGDGGLLSSTEYCYRVAAFNAGGDSDYSEPACATTSAPPPTAPAGLNAAAAGTDTVDIAWNDLSGDETGFRIERALGTGGAFAEIDQVGEGEVAYADSGLIDATEYCYRVLAFNAAGNSEYSNEACATTDTAPPSTPPADPANLTTSSVGSDRIDLSWDDVSDDEAGFRIERALAIGGAYVEIDLTGSDVSVYQNGGLTAETEFCYRLSAFNAAGDSGYTNESCATTGAAGGPLAAPTNLLATAPTDDAVQLTWSDNATEESAFDIYRSTAGVAGPYARLQIVITQNLTAYTDSSVTADQEYCYQVRVASGPTSFGPFSAPACATPGAVPPTIPADPTGLVLSVVSHDRIDLGWTDESTDELGFRIQRAGDAAEPFTEIDLTGPEAVNYPDTGLEPETQYCYQVAAYNGAGTSGFSAIECATTLAAPDPGECVDTGPHDDLSGLWGITTVKADLNATWQATQVQDCEVVPWFFAIDTGVDRDHPDLNVIETMDFNIGGGSGEDDHGHGTHTAGTAAAIDGNGGVVGVAPGAPVYGFKVCSAGGSCPLDAIVRGVDEVTARRMANPSQPMVANMSLGGGISASNDTAVRRSVNSGVVYTVSAGNGAFGACIVPGDAQSQSPARTGDDDINASGGSNGDTARINGIITVTSSNPADSDVNCNFGDPVTVAAPGEAILSTWLRAGYNTISGTSMAAPHAAGAALLYLQRFPDATPEEVEQAIVNDLDPWTTNDTPNADGRLAVEDL